MPHGREPPIGKDLSLFQVDVRFTRKSAIRVTKLQIQASISRHIPNGIAAVPFQFLKGVGTESEESRHRDGAASMTNPLPTGIR